MGTPFFQDIAISAQDVSTWPESPDRTLTGAGRAGYADSLAQAALTSQPTKSVTLSQYENFLNSYGPFQLGSAILYEKDPVLDLIKVVVGTNVYFQDDSFSPSSDAKRIDDLITSPIMYSQGPTLTDMGQESLGDCGFVSTFCAISVHPAGHNLLFSSIYPTVYNPIGLYSMRIISGGKVGYLLLDDLLPNEGYSDMENSEFWYFLIEKAFAKLLGGYDKLGGGCEGYIGIQSTDNTWIDSSNQDTVWQNQLIPTFQTQNSTTYQGTGNSTTYLVSGHAYSVIDAAEYSTFQLVRLHNPWNTVKYSGAFCPGSSSWDQIPQDIQKSTFQVDRFEANTTFWMPYDDYITDIGKISNLYLDTSIPSCLQAIANSSPIQTSISSKTEKQTTLAGTCC